MSKLFSQISKRLLKNRTREQEKQKSNTGEGLSVIFSQSPRAGLKLMFFPFSLKLNAIMKLHLVGRIIFCLYQSAPAVVVVN